jgi:hypothetical protein
MTSFGMVRLGMVRLGMVRLGTTTLAKFLLPFFLNELRWGVVWTVLGMLEQDNGEGSHLEGVNVVLT